MAEIQAFIASNPVVCIAVVFVIYAFGDFLGTFSKAWIPSTFVMAVVFLVGYWTILPPELIPSTGIITFVNPIGFYLLICHMGTTINLKELAKQWKVIVVCLAGLAGMVALAIPICGMFVDSTYVIAGIPPLTGGIVAASIMQMAATEKGLEVAALIAIAMYSFQGFAGYPLTAIFLKKEAKKLIANRAMMEKAAKVEEKVVEKKKLIPEISNKYLSTTVILAKLSLVSILAFYIGVWTKPWGNFAIHGLVAALLLGVICTEIGFLDKDALRKCGCFNIVALFVMVYIFDGLKNATIELLTASIGSMAFIVVVGVTGMILAVFLASKLVKMSTPLAIASALTSLYGFPPNYVLTEEASKAVAKDEDERQYLMDNMWPQMMVGGFTTVTITSVIIAGIFANML